MNELSQKMEQMEKFVRESRQREMQSSVSQALVKEMKAMHDKNTILLQEVATLQGVVQELSKDHTALLKQTSRMSSDFSDLQKDVFGNLSQAQGLNERAEEMASDLSKLKQQVAKTMTSQTATSANMISETKILTTKINRLQHEIQQLKRGELFNQIDTKLFEENVCQLNQKVNQIGLDKASSKDLNQLRDEIQQMKVKVQQLESTGEAKTQENVQQQRKSKVQQRESFSLKDATQSQEHACMARKDSQIGVEEDLPSRGKYLKASSNFKR